jgi:hypothetical protein
MRGNRRSERDVGEGRHSKSLSFLRAGQWRALQLCAVILAVALLPAADSWSQAARSSAQSSAREASDNPRTTPIDEMLAAEEAKGKSTNEEKWREWDRKIDTVLRSICTGC